MANFYKLENGKLKPAPMVYPPKEAGGKAITAPTAEEHAEHGAYPYRPVQAETREGFAAQCVGYEVVDGAWQPIYDYDPIPAVVRRWSSLAIKRTLQTAGKWDEVKAMMVAADKYDDFLMADYIAEDDDDFRAVYAVACEAYGTEAVDALIDAIPMEV